MDGLKLAYPVKWQKKIVYFPKLPTKRKLKHSLGMVGF